MLHLLFIYAICYGQNNPIEWGYVPKYDGTYDESKYQSSKNQLIESYERESGLSAANVLLSMGTSYQDASRILAISIKSDSIKTCRQILSFDKSYKKKIFPISGYKLITLDTTKWESLVTYCTVCINKLPKKAKINISNPHNPLINQLRYIMSQDQKYRGQLAKLLNENKQDSPEMKELWKKQDKIDHLNLVLVEAIINEYGYPGLNLVGPKFNDYALKVLHHQPSIKIREKYLPILEQAVKDGELNSIEFFIARTEMLKADAKKEEETALPEN